MENAAISNLVAWELILPEIRTWSRKLGDGSAVSLQDYFGWGHGIAVSSVA